MAVSPLTTHLDVAYRQELGVGEPYLIKSTLNNRAVLHDPQAGISRLNHTYFCYFAAFYESAHVRGLPAHAAAGTGAYLLPRESPSIYGKAPQPFLPITHRSVVLQLVTPKKQPRRVSQPSQLIQPSERLAHPPSAHRNTARFSICTGGRPM